MKAFCYLQRNFQPETNIINTIIIYHNKKKKLKKKNTKKKKNNNQKNDVKSLTPAELTGNILKGDTRPVNSLTMIHAATSDYLVKRKHYMCR